MANSLDLLERFRDLRNKNPALDDEIQHTASRRELAAALVGLRRAAGLTQDEIAEAVGKGNADISRIESTAGELDPDLLARYIDACRVCLEAADEAPPTPTDPE